MRDLLVGDDDLLRSLVGSFLADAPTRVAEIREASQAADADGVERAAHGLKGAAVNLGANELAGLAGRLEGIGVARQLPADEQLLNWLHHELDRVRGELQSLLRGV